MYISTPILLHLYPFFLTVTTRAWALVSNVASPRLVILEEGFHDIDGGGISWVLEVLCVLGDQ